MAFFTPLGGKKKQSDRSRKDDEESALSQKSNAGDTTPPDFKPYLRAMVMETSLYGH